jgi:uncharacterized membrane protein YtjA (UPF0391 family)
MMTFLPVRIPVKISGDRVRDARYDGHESCSAGGGGIPRIPAAAAATLFIRIISATYRREGPMLRYAAIFFVIAIIAAVFGFGGIAAGAAEIAKVLYFIFIVIFLITLLMGVVRR